MEEGVGVQARRRAGLQGVDGLKLFRCQGKAENVQVLALALAVRGLRHRHPAVLDMPAQDNLGGGFAELPRRSGHRRMAEELTVAAQRAVGGSDYPVPTVPGQLRRLAVLGVHLDLVQRDGKACVLNEP